MTKQRLMLLLGSGVSLQSYQASQKEIPSVKSITDTVASGAQEETELCQRLKKIGFSEQCRMPKYQQFLRALKPYVDQYFVKTYGLAGQCECNYEHLGYLCWQLFYYLSDWTANPATADFAEKVAENTKSLCGCDAGATTQLEHLRSVFGPFAEKAREFIQWVIWERLLLHNPMIKGLDLIVEMATDERIERLDICTLNHDTLVEDLLRNNGIRFTDGFGEGNGAFRPYNPSTYEQNDAKVRLFKLHGSIDWHHFRQFPNNGAIVLGIPVELNIGKREWSDVSGVKWHRQDPPLILAGTGNKPADKNDYYAFSDIWCWFHWLLMHHDTLVLSGCSLGDDDVYGHLWGWLASNRSNRLIGLYQKNAEPARLLELEEQYKSNVTLAEKWLSDTKLDDLLALLPQGVK